MFEELVGVLCGLFIMSAVVNLGFSLSECLFVYLRKRYPKLNDYLPSWRVYEDKWKLKFGKEKDKEES